MPHMLYNYANCTMVYYQLLIVDNHYDSLVKYAKNVKYIEYYCLYHECRHKPTY